MSEGGVQSGGAGAGVPVLEAVGLSKRFPGVRALEGVSLGLRGGEVLAVIGENGAGKSTLMKILAGVQAPDRGEIRMGGRSVRMGCVREAEVLGVALIHQELNLADNLDVASNVYLGRELSRWGWADRKAMEAGARGFLARVGLECDPRVRVSELSLGQQQMVEIAKALSREARVLIMDEPTSSLSQGETERLYRVVRELIGQGVSVVYISHRLGEVTELADRVVVLRDGRVAGELGRGEIGHDAMVRLMVGRELGRSGRGSRAGSEAGPLLEVHGMRTQTNPTHAVSFDLGPGEIVGIAGLVGSGRTELLRGLFGIDRLAGGEVRVAGELVELRSPRDAIRAGMGLVPEDRKVQGLILEMGVGWNIVLASMDRGPRAPWVDGAGDAARGARQVARLGVRTPGLEQPVQYLSGGNQQKVVLAKWLELGPRVLMLDEPTRGIDVGAKQEIYRLMEELAASGVAILFASSEMEEVLRMSDRVLVMHEGGLAGELTGAAITEEGVMRLATGGGDGGGTEGR